MTVTVSMTGFASAKGHEAGFSWAWELRSVNSKGLDLRLRVPDWVPGLEAALRARLSRDITRGAVTLSLRLGREDETGQLTLDMAQLDAVLDALAAVETRALDRGISLAPSRAADLLGLRGVLDTASADDDGEALRTALMTAFEPLIADFLAMRRAEGAALNDVIAAQLDTIAGLTAEAAEAAQARRDEQAEALNAALARVMDGAAGVDEARIAQELALIAVKADITEELDRLTAHVAAARELLSADAPIGRKFDFLAQEFNREANTLCSKSGAKALTAIGLELKTVIDQMREQIQNVE